MILSFQPSTSAEAGGAIPAAPNPYFFPVGGAPPAAAGAPPAAAARGPPPAAAGAPPAAGPVPTVPPGLAPPHAIHYPSQDPSRLGSTHAALQQQ